MLKCCCCGGVFVWRLKKKLTNAMHFVLLLVPALSSSPPSGNSIQLWDSQEVSIPQQTCSHEIFLLTGLEKKGRNTRTEQTVVGTRLLCSLSPWQIVCRTSGKTLRWQRDSLSSLLFPEQSRLRCYSACLLVLNKYVCNAHFVCVCVHGYGFGWFLSVFFFFQKRW